MFRLPHALKMYRADLSTFSSSFKTTFGKYSFHSFFIARRRNNTGIFSNLHHWHSPQHCLRFWHDICVSTVTNYGACCRNVSVKKFRTTFARQFAPMYKPITLFTENATGVVIVKIGQGAVRLRDKICSRGLYCDFGWFGFQKYTTFNLNIKVSFLLLVLVSIGFGAFHVFFFPLVLVFQCGKSSTNSLLARLSCLPSFSFSSANE